MTDIENILNDALNLRPSDRALLAQQLINSLSKEDDDIEQQWIKLSNHRLDELKAGRVNSMNWADIRLSVKNRK